MLDRAGILALIPHQGAMCLLDRALRWDREGILCAARSHLDPANPLRRAGRLGTICGVEYAMQAAALHGALQQGALQHAAPRAPGLLVALRGLEIHAPLLDDPGFGELRVQALMEQVGSAGLRYAFRLHSESGRLLLAGRGTVALPQSGDE